jgi:hypothetical protein
MFAASLIHLSEDCVGIASPTVLPVASGLTVAVADVSSVDVSAVAAVVSVEELLLVLLESEDELPHPASIVAIIETTRIALKTFFFILVILPVFKNVLFTNILGKNMCLLFVLGLIWRLFFVLMLW